MRSLHHGRTRRVHVRVPLTDIATVLWDGDSLALLRVTPGRHASSRRQARGASQRGGTVASLGDECIGVLEALASLTDPAATTHLSPEYVKKYTQLS